MISLTPQDAAPSFDQPLEMLRACHGKILRLCDTLQRLAIHLISQGCDDQARQAAQDILRYFDSAGQFHHQDEEEDVFPALCLAAGPDHVQLHALLDRLLSEHVVMLAAWTALRPVLVRLAEGVDTPLTAILTAEFIDSYTAHIAVENGELLPLAAGLLGPEQASVIGKHMAQRRGAKFPAGV